jgi:predicted nucleic acid-binding protein
LKVRDALSGLSRIFLDTAPVIYYVEKHPIYDSLVTVAFNEIDNGNLVGIASPITLAECLVHPYRLGLTQLQQDFTNLILNSRNVHFDSVDQQIAIKATELRAQYNIGLLDAFQIAIALATNCDAILTNDSIFRRVTEIKVIMIDDLEL